MSSPVETTNTLKEFLPLIGVIVGGVVAIVGGFISNYFFEWRSRVTESKSLAFAFRGEVQALCNIAEKRGYLEHIKQIITHMEQSGETIFVHINVRREYFNVFKSNVNKIGCLKNPLPELISRYYVQSNSILEDLESYRDGSLGTANVESMIASKKELVALMEDTLLLGKDIVSKIDGIYS
jgi:hypothetical protein